VAAVILEPVQNGGGCFVPQDGYFQRVREICDEHNVLLISDEVICSWGVSATCSEASATATCRHHHDREGLTSACIPMGAMIVSDRVAEPFMQGTRAFATASRSAVIRCRCGRARCDRPLRARGHLRHVRAKEVSSVRRSRACATCRSSVTSAAPATSRRSSSSRTSRHVRRSPTRSPRISCAASSRRAVSPRADLPRR